MSSADSTVNRTSTCPPADIARRRIEDWSRLVRSPLTNKAGRTQLTYAPGVPTRLNLLGGSVHSNIDRTKLRPPISLISAPGKLSTSRTASPRHDRGSCCRNRRRRSSQTARGPVVARNRPHCGAKGTSARAAAQRRCRVSPAPWRTPIGSRSTPACPSVHFCPFSSSTRPMDPADVRRRQERGERASRSTRTGTFWYSGS
jgi:hypothetical protein